MAEPKLIHPDKKYATSFVAALREGLHLDPAKEEDILLAERNFDAYISRSKDLSRPVTLPSGEVVRRVPQTELWLVNEKDFLGRVLLRPQLNEHLTKRGGNIGYAIRKNERRKGYGALILKLALPHAKEMGLEKALITCNDDNLGSIRIIEGAGAALQDKIPIDGLAVLHRRYWINL